MTTPSTAHDLLHGLDLAVLFDELRTAPFGGRISHSAVVGIKAIIRAWGEHSTADTTQLAYILATAFHETGRFVHMEEIASGEAYEGRADLGNDQPGDGKRYKGRGFVQITGRRNYRELGKRIGVDLERQPQRAAETNIAAAVLVIGMVEGLFTGKRLDEYVTQTRYSFVEARRVVNGTDRASEISRYAQQFLAAIHEAEIDEVPWYDDASEPKGEPMSDQQPNEVTPVTQSATAQAGIYGGIVTAVWSTLVAFGLIPQALQSPDVAVPITGILTTLASVIGALLARRAAKRDN